MRKTFMTTIMAAMLTLGAAGVSLADDNGHHDGPTILGNVNMEITTGSIFNSAVGEESSATVDVGSILSGDLRGNIDMLISTGDIVNSATEEDTDATVRVGVIGR